MTWISRWKIISTQITQIQEVSRSYFDSINSFGVDHYGIGGSSLIPAARDIFAEVVDMKKSFPMIPRDVIMIIAKLEKNFSSHHKFTGIPGVGGAMVHLGIFNSEMNFYLKNNETLIKDKVKLAFLHLQRTLIVDADARKKWTTAFNEGEESIEKLGANHLLAHGLWAFKSCDETLKKDLVLGTAIRAEEVQAVGACLVLTEWKKTTPETILEQSKAAFADARKHSEEPVAGSELKFEKYLILVSENLLSVPASVVEDDVRYVYMNLAINPLYAELKKEAMPSMTWTETNP
ncbi:MAG: hypothetical protein H7326_11985 [Bdellovibrionaceae bacterium]|nr:hypothetical protein [Pseudobdellovibrionaceae bacterium]